MFTVSSLAIPVEQRKKPISVLCTDTRVEIPAIADMIEGALRRCRKCSQQNNLNIDASVAPTFRSASGVGLRSARAGLKAGATIEESFWVNIIGRGYPPPNRTFRCVGGCHSEPFAVILSEAKDPFHFAQGKLREESLFDPVNVFVKQRIGHWGEAILHLGARRAESSTRAQTMAARATRTLPVRMARHPDLPRVWVSNPIEFLTTEDVWAYLLQNVNPWGGDNRPGASSPPPTPNSLLPTPYRSCVPSRLTPAPQVAATAGSGVGRVRWLIATRRVKDCWPAATSAWKS